MLIPSAAAAAEGVLFFSAEGEIPLSPPRLYPIPLFQPSALSPFLPSPSKPFLTFNSVLPMPRRPNSKLHTEFSPSTAGRCMADFESAVNLKIQILLKANYLRFNFIS